MRILLVEDEPEMASVLRTALHKRGVLVDHAATLADGGRHVEATPYDAASRWCRTCAPPATISRC